MAEFIRALRQTPPGLKADAKVNGIQFYLTQTAPPGVTMAEWTISARSEVSIEALRPISARINRQPPHSREFPCVITNGWTPRACDSMAGSICFARPSSSRILM